MTRPTAGSVVVAALTDLALTVGTAHAGGSSTPITIGQTIQNSTPCGDFWFIQTSPSGYSVPAGNWVVTSWSTYAGDYDASGHVGGYMSMMIFRPAAGGTYDVVGESPVEALTADSLNTFTLATPIAVQGGDLLGMYENGNNCGVNTAGGTLVGGFPPQPAAGANVATAWSNGAFLSNVSATLEQAGGTLTVTKRIVSNRSDPSRFNLRIDGITLPTSATAAQPEQSS